MKKQRNKSFKKPTISQTYNKMLLEFSSQSIDKTIKQLNSTNTGLTQKQVEKNLEKMGNNSVVAKQKFQKIKMLVSAIFTPFSIVLMVIAVLNIAIPGPDHSISRDSWICFGIIIAMVLISSGIRFFQEIRSFNSSEKLKKMITTTTAVEREGVKKEIPIADVCVGDIIHLAAGDMIPADLKIINAKDLFVSQGALTGESEPIEKFAINNSDSQQALDRNNLCFMGTTVSSGTAKGIVISVGQGTYFGKVAKSIQNKKPKTNFDKGIRSVSTLLICTMLVLALIIFILSGTIVNKNGWIEALEFTLAVAVGITPEMLPMIVTVNLAKESFKLSKQKIIVKKINAIQSFGAMDVLCTDKTGTLTEDRIVLERHINLNGKEDNRVLVYGFLNSYYQTGLKNLLDLAIIDKANECGLNEEVLNFKKIDEIPFDFQRRRMSVVLQDKAGETQLVTKGAIEEIVSVCSYAEINGERKPLDDKLKMKIKETINDLSEEGMRVIAIAINNDKFNKKDGFNVGDEKNLCLIGYIALLDPPKMSAAGAIKAMQNRGTKVKVLTGDNELITKYICKKVGIKVDKILLGSDIENMNDDELKDVVMDVNVFAKLSPEQKERVVLAIKSKKHIVGFMGDGINDAPAMRAADIAISVDTAVDIAKECADIILLEKNLMVLENGIIEGRKTFANIIKYIKMTVSSNFGNVLSMLIATIWLRFEPMQSIQILILNMISDFCQFALPWDHVDKEYFEKPQNWNAISILKFMLFIGPISTIFDISTFAIMRYGLNWGSTEETLSLFQTGWFLVSLLTQMGVVLVLRTSKIPLFQSRPSLPITLSITCLTLIGIMFVVIPDLNFGGFSSLSHNCPEMIGYALAISFGYCCTAQLGKLFYKKAFHEWL